MEKPKQKNQKLKKNEMEKKIPNLKVKFQI